MRGYSLVEILAALFVGALLATALADMAGVLVRVSHYTLTRADLQSGAMVGVNRLSRELRGTSPLTLTIISQPVALAFREQADGPYSSVNFTPAPTFVVYYFDTGLHALMRMTAPAPATGRMPPAQLAQLVATPNGTESAAAHDVNGLQLAPATFPTTDLANTIAITLQLQEPLSSTQNVSMTMRTAVMLRNGP